MAGRPQPPAVPGQDVLRRKERAENFPVALLVLPRRIRVDLRAVYDVVRVIDDLGDEADGDRIAALARFSADLSSVWSTGQPRAAVLQSLARTAHRTGLTQQPFDDLIRANLLDQTVTGYDSFDDLMGYCTLSAAPIGRIVLQLFGAASPRREHLSDRVCAGLQILEHCQDVAEDRRAGRTYLPQQDMRRFGVDAADLDAMASGPALRRLIDFETRQAEALLESGPELLADLSGWIRLAVSGYLAGGRAAVDALRRPDIDVLVAAPKARRVDVLRHLAATIRRRRP